MTNPAKDDRTAARKVLDEQIASEPPLPPPNLVAGTVASPVERHLSILNEIKGYTKLLRTNADPYWERLRELLAGRGIDPNGSILVESFPDDSSFEFGVVITQDGRVFQFGFDYLNKEISQGEFSEWQELTEGYQDSPYAESVKVGIELRNTVTKICPG